MYFYKDYTLVVNIFLLRSSDEPEIKKENILINSLPFPTFKIAENKRTKPVK
jgi:hypothetical protein